MLQSFKKLQGGDQQWYCKTLLQRWFSLNFAKFLRTPILWSIWERLWTLKIKNHHKWDKLSQFCDIVIIYCKINKLANIFSQFFSSISKHLFNWVHVNILLPEECFPYDISEPNWTSKWNLFWQIVNSWRLSDLQVGSEYSCAFVYWIDIKFFLANEEHFCLCVNIFRDYFYNKSCYKKLRARVSQTWVLSAAKLDHQRFGIFLCLSFWNWTGFNLVEKYIL